MIAILIFNILNFAVFILYYYPFYTSNELSKDLIFNLSSNRGKSLLQPWHHRHVLLPAIDSLLLDQ